MAELPLNDLKVLDLTRLLPGGFCTQLMADLGADVIKVEDVGMGDYVRWAPPYYGGEQPAPDGTNSALFLSLNRNKRSIRLDLKQAGGREALLRLVADSDVVVEGFRPGVLERLGVGYAQMRAVKPALVYCAITGYGQTGPLRDRAGHDQNYLALNGVLGLSGPPATDPAAAAGRSDPGNDDGAELGAPPTMAAVQIADLGGGAMMAAFGIMAALHAARRSGEGQLVDISMTDGSLSWQAMIAGAFLCSGELPERGGGIISGGALCYMPYAAADGWVSCAALEPKFWAAFCNGVDRPDLIEHQFDRHSSAAWGEVAAIFRTRTRAEWAEFNAEHDCCIEPILDLAQVIASDLVRERQMLVEWEQPGIGAVRQLGSPLKLGSGAEPPSPAVRLPAPGLGEHTEAVLAEAGFGSEEIAALREKGAIAGPPQPGEAGATLDFRA